MTTIINNPSGNGDNSSGSMFAIVIIIILLIVGGFFVYRYGFHRSSPASPTNINVTVPNPISNPSNQ